VKIALAGTRGVPAAYSGFETAVENIGVRLAERGHDVTVYCRPHMVEGRYRTYRGMRLVYLPTVASKHLDTFVHTFVSTLHLGFLRRPDVAIYFIAGNSPFAGICKALGVPSLLNVDGLDSPRGKWGGAAKRYLRWTERNAPRLASAVITDSRILQKLYREEFGAETCYIPYGADTGGADADGADTGEVVSGDCRKLAGFGLEPRGYILFVHRLVPENNAHVLVDAFAQLVGGAGPDAAAEAGAGPDLKLVVVGDAPYADAYQADLRARAEEVNARLGSERVLLPGYVFGKRYRALARNAAVFVVPTEVGGTHPVLLEAMAAGNAIVVNDHAPNMEVVGDAAASYRGAEGAEGLAAVLRELLADPARMEDLRRRARERALRLYSWEAVTDAYERLARRLTEPRR
jgi:glycosyltransferase involved in cell wall biosynthesis